MNNTTTQYTVSQSTTAEYDIKKSRFIGMIASANNETEAIKHLQALAAQHPNANHLAFAWRIRQSDGFINERCHDAGEPSGTAGRPILAPLEGGSICKYWNINLINVMVKLLNNNSLIGY